MLLHKLSFFLILFKFTMNKNVTTNVNKDNVTCFDLNIINLT